MPNPKSLQINDILTASPIFLLRVMARSGGRDRKLVDGTTAMSGSN